MLDQSFSSDNFRQILDYENRKGIYLEGRFFPEIDILTGGIKKCNEEIRANRKTMTPFEFETSRRSINEKKEKLKEEKEEMLKSILQHISENVVNNKFIIKLLRKDSESGKPVYIPASTAENYFALKQIQFNFRKLYKVKQSNRFAIVSQVKELLNNSFPKYVIRTDLQDFYESIPHEILLQKLNEENLLTFYSKRIVFQILNDYKRLSGNTKGLPRGVGISAYLAELYMRDIDKIISSLPSVTYYARYVDDIIIIFTPLSKKEPKNYITAIDEIIETKYSLTRNRTKTAEFDLIESGKSCNLEYLGYNFQFGNCPVKLRLTRSKILKYKSRIDLILKAYINHSKLNEKKARKLLVKRLNFITGNTRLINNKKNILVGIYYSNNLVTETNDFWGLDCYLTNRINQNISNEILRNRLAKYKFQEGFLQKRFSPFTTHDLSEILEIL